MTDNFIQLGKSGVLRFNIRTDEGVDTGEYLEFDMEDIELPLIYQEIGERLKKNQDKLKNQLLIINKRQDVKGKKLLSKNQEDEIRAVRDFVNEQVNIYNMFLGKNGVQKLLNGRKPTYEMFEYIDEIIEKQIMPHLNFNIETIKDKIKNKYKKDNEEEIEVLE